MSSPSQGLTSVDEAPPLVRPKHSSGAPASEAPSVGTRWLTFIAAILVICVLYASTWGTVLERWLTDPTYSHGFLVMAAALWMSYRVWVRGELDDTQPGLVGIVLLLVAGSVWLAATAASIAAVQQLALPSMLLSTAWLLFGKLGARRLLVPIGVLILVLPVWDVIRLPLQDMTTVVVGGLLHAFGIPAIIYGHYIELPAGTFEVAEGCSGLHFFMAATALAAIQGQLFVKQTWAKFSLLLLVIAVAILANWIRVIAVVIAGHVTDMQHWLLHDHYYFGWFVFFVLMLPVILFGNRLESAEPAVRSSTLSLSGNHRNRRLIVFSLVGVMLPALVWSVVNSVARPAPHPVLPATFAGMTLLGEASSDWAPKFPTADVLVDGRYGADGESIDVWIVFYESQSSGHELVGYGNALARPNDGELVSSETLGQMRLMTGTNFGRSIHYRYIVAGSVTVLESTAKLIQIRGNLLGRPSAYAVVVSSVCRLSDCAASNSSLENFAEKMAAILAEEH